MKYIALLLMLWFAIPPSGSAFGRSALPANSSLCRNVNGHSICILSINRSAKNHWEYRAAISIDGVKHPIEVYNCRDRVKVHKDGTLVSFEPNSPGELICRTVNR